MSDEGFFSRWSRRKQLAKQGAPALAAPSAAPVRPEPFDGTQDRPVEGRHPATDVRPEPVAGRTESPDRPAPVPAPPAPTLDDVAQLTRESDYSAFVAQGVDDDVKRAAMKKLFSDPHFNRMDGLDVYIDDYSQPDPIPLAMLRQMNQSKFLGLFESDDEASDKAAEEAPPPPGPASEFQDSPIPLSTQAPIQPPTQAPLQPPIQPPIPQQAEPAPAGSATPCSPSRQDHDHADLQLQPDHAAGRQGAV